MDGAKLARPAERCLGVHQALTWLGDEAMKRHLGTTHLWVGLATLFFFAVTGQLMDRWNLDQMSIESALRQLYRSRHIYLLFGGLVNLAVSMRFVLPAAGEGSRVAVAGSLLMLVSPAFQALAFFIEPPRLGHTTFLTILGVFSAYIGLLFYCLGTRKIRFADVLVTK